MSVLTQSALIASLVLLALAVGALVSGRRTRPFLYFSLLNFILFAWELSRFLSAITQAVLWTRMGLTAALFIPFAALRFFEAWLSAQGRVARWATRVVGLTTLVLIPVVFSPLWSAPWFGGFLLAYVYSGLLVCVALVWLRLGSSRGPVESGRLKFLALGGMAAVGLSLPAYVPEWGEVVWASSYLPAAGNAVLVIFMYFLSQILLQYRLLDLSELVGKLSVLAVLVLLLAGIWGVLAIWTPETGGLFFFHTIIAAFVILILFEPLRGAVEGTVNRLLFRDRFRFVHQLGLLRREITTVVELEELAAALLRRLEETRRVTHAALYALEDDGLHLRLVGSLGEPPERLEVARHRRFLEALRRERVLVLAEVEDALAEVDEEDEEERAAAARLKELLAGLRAVQAGVCLGLLSEDRVLGLLSVNDARMREPFAPEDVRALEQIASQAAIGLENSRLVRGLRERDRLAALGEMAAGLAHEIRNPLGAIKGAAQLLSDPPADEGEAAASNEFLGIILEEVDRLDRVVGSVLDLARPSSSSVVPVDVNAVVRRTLQVLSAERSSEELVVEVVLDPSLPRVAIDAEQLRQVVMNLFRNAAQAMRGRGRITVSSRVRFGRGTRPGVRQKKGEAEETWVELTVADNGPGMSKTMLEKIFLPFFTTREKGTGLGLAISQRIAQAAGGRLEVRSYEGKGSAFTMIVPAAPEPASTPTPGPARTA